MGTACKSYWAAWEDIFAQTSMLKNSHNRPLAEDKSYCKPVEY